MTQRLGEEVDVRLQIAKDYDQGIAQLTSGKVDFSRFGPASYIEAKKVNDGLSILAMESKDNEKVFYGIIAVHKDSPIQHVTELHGRSFAFGDEGSTIGRFLSQLHLEQNGIRAVDLSLYEYLGRHDKVGTAVGAGDFDAGALNEATFKKLVDAGEPIRELARFPNVTKPWIARSGLEPRIYEALVASLLDITDMKALKGLKTGGFLEGDDSDYSVIRTAMDNNFVFFTDPANEPKKAPVNTQAPDASVSSAVQKAEAPVAAAAQPAQIASQPVAAESVATKTNDHKLAVKPIVASAQALQGAVQHPAMAQHSVAIPSATAVQVAQPQPAQATFPVQAVLPGNNITINIAIPQSLLNSASQNGSSSTQLTINLSMPAGVNEPVVPATAIPAQ